MIRVLLVDDHTVVRTGIRRILEGDSDIHVVAEVDRGEAVLGAVRRHQPDIVLMDIGLPGINGLEATHRALRVRPAPRVLVLSVHGEAPYPERLLEAGASGYVTKGAPPEELVEAIHTLARGGRYIGSDVARDIALSRMPGAPRSPLEQLSRREVEVMLMVVRGHDVRDISRRLCVSPKTVTTYRTRLFAKLGVDNDVQLTHLALRHGLISDQPWV